MVRRHWRVVVLFPLLVAGGAYLSGRKVIPQFRSGLTIQVGSSKQVFARMDDIDFDEMALRTDPVLSEALILTTQDLALKVVDALQLRLQLIDPTIPRRSIFGEIRVDSTEALEGNYEVVFSGPDGYELRDVGGSLLASGTYGTPTEGPGFSFTVQPSVAAAPPANSISFRVVPAASAAAGVRGRLSYSVRKGTNAVDLSFTGTDALLVPRILNQAAQQLRLSGARRAREAAIRRRTYISEQVEVASQQYDVKLRELQAFKEQQQITDLSTEERAIVNAIQDIEQQRQRLLVQVSTLEDAMAQADSIGVETLNRLAAVEGISQNSALDFQINNLLSLYDEQRTLTAGALGLRETNPQVDAVNERIRHGHDALRSAVEAALESMTSRLEALDDKIGENRSRLMTFPGKQTFIAQLKIESDILFQTLQYLLGQYEAARLQEATIAPYVTILDGASPAFRIGTSRRQKLVLGFLVGLLLGLGGAFFLEYLDQTIKSSSDIERTLGIPVLGMIPDDQLLSSVNGRRRAIVPLTEISPDEPPVEAYKALRTNVTFVGAESPLQYIAVTSPGPGEGKSTTATNLAITLAQGGHRSILMDADLRRPQTHRAFGLVAEPGLTDVLVGNLNAREAIRPEVTRNLDFLPSGSLPPNPSELLGSDTMHALISELRSDYDYIIVDTPPTLPVTDAAVVAAAADATILVVKSGDTEDTAAQRAIEQLHQVRARVAGAVLNGVTAKRDRDYTYYNYYSYKPQKGRRSLKTRLSNLL